MEISFTGSRTEESGVWTRDSCVLYS